MWTELSVWPVNRPGPLRRHFLPRKHYARYNFLTYNAIALRAPDLGLRSLQGVAEVLRINERLANHALIGTIVVVSLLTGCHTRRLQNERDAALAVDLRDFVASLSAQDEFSGAVLLARNRSPLLRSGFGLANRETWTFQYT
jgi:hypothetical protein